MLTHEKAIAPSNAQSNLWGSNMVHKTFRCHSKPTGCGGAALTMPQGSEWCKQTHQSRRSVPFLHMSTPSHDQGDARWYTDSVSWGQRNAQACVGQTYLEQARLADWQRHLYSITTRPCYVTGSTLNSVRATSSAGAGSHSSSTLCSPMMTQPRRLLAAVAVMRLFLVASCSTTS